MTAVFFRAQCVSSLSKKLQKNQTLACVGLGGILKRKMPGKSRNLPFDWEGARRGCACRECGHMPLSPLPTYAAAMNTTLNAALTKISRTSYTIYYIMSSSTSPRESFSNLHRIRSILPDEQRDKAHIPPPRRARVRLRGALPDFCMNTS